ncbi:signal peptidase II [Sphingosinicella sp. BN140058]|uniref:signal peptidase II n=1 Tax=Sphingosinicella sp. BN140058 TaxID=1892855 RepID=UPI001012EE84|nr:signal peptidase II [Sphingosinicella sp. BN140058]QAY75785.1 signal peptidase II [Sphingosinicella sp. BN140058]
MAELSAADRERIQRNRKLGMTIAATVLLLDQASKWIVTYVLQLQQQVVITLAPIFDLRWVENRGVSMGFLTAGSPLERWLLVAMTGAISIFVVTWMWRERRRDDAIALAFVLGGALGNIIDRIRLGYVVDFADLHFGDIHPFLVFNVGDAAITIGVLLLLVRALLTRDRTPAPEDK